MKRVTGIVTFLAGFVLFSGALAIRLVKPDKIASPILLFGLLIMCLGLAPLWNAGLIPLRFGRRRPRPASQGGGGIPSAFGEPLTPSEAVAVCGARFAGGRAAGGSIGLLDGVTTVSARDLVHAQLKAAFLAHEQAGAIRLVVSDNHVLRVEPTGVPVKWPSPSTEARLDLEFARDVSEIVGRWAAEPSSHPWTRAAEKTYAAMVLRGVAAVGQEGRDRRYRLADSGLESAARRDADAIAGLLQKCETERPEIFRLLSKAIESGVHRPGTPKAYVQIDPWYDEAAAEVAAIPGLQLRGDVRTWMSHPLTVTVVLAVVIAIVVFMATNGKWMPSKAPGDRTTPSSAPMFWASVALMAVLGGATILRKRAGRAITEFVVKQPETASIDRAEVGLTMTTGSSGAAAVRAPAELPFDIQILKAPALPPLSEAARKRVEAIHERGPAVNRLYRTSAIWLIAGALALAIFMWTDPSTLLLAVPASVLCAFYFQYRQWTDPLKAIAGGAAEERMQWEKEITPIRPVVGPLIGVVWAVATAAQGIDYLLHAATPWNWVGVTAASALSAWYFIRLRIGLSKLQLRYPVYPPLNLLVLRVFESPSRDFFLKLIDSWHWLGPLSRLDGPDTAGQSAGAVMAYLTGRVDKAVTEDGAELEAALGHFGHRRDGQLRFPFNSLQCTNDTWKAALNHLLAGADVIVMDLSGLTEKHRGCAHEISLLINEYPFDRFVFLIDGNTDVEFLKRLIAEHSRQAPVSGPRETLRLLHMGSETARRPGESVLEWQRRSSTPIQPDRLVGLLCDAALRKTGPQEPSTVPWARPGFLPAPMIE